MIADNQDAVVEMLKDPATYGEAGPVETIETHISRIFLVGRRAFKMKRAVKLPYVDFSTPELRFAACEKEVDLKALSKELKSKFACGGTVKDGCIRLQGDKKKLVQKTLREMGYTLEGGE